MGAALAALEMQPHEYAALQALAEEGGISQAELAATLRIHPSNLVALLDGLEADRLIERRRDPNDRRRQLLGLTLGGRDRLERARGAVEDAEHELLSPLGDADRARLHDYLGQLASHACRARSGKAHRC
jgi:DNA-binding MarR family transcriptional regulator